MEVSVRRTSRALIALGVDVVLAAPAPPCDSRTPAPDTEHLVLPSRRFHSPRYARALRGAFRSLHRSAPIDVVLSESAAGYAVLDLCRRAAVPICIRAHGTAVRELRAALRRRSPAHLAYRTALLGLDALALRRVDAIAAVSDEIASELRRFLGPGAPRIETIVNGVPVDFFAPDPVRRRRMRADLEPSTKVVLFVGRLTREKGPDLLFDAVASPLVDPRTIVWAIGDGPLRDQLSDHALKEANRVRFWGNVPQAVVRDAMCAADALVLPSRRAEGMPYVILEALAAGLPVVASDALGMKIPEVTYHLAGDPAALASAVNTALRRTPPVTESRALIRHRFSLEAQAKALLALLGSITATRSVAEAERGRRPPRNHSRS